MYIPTVSRRVTLQWFTAASIASALPGSAKAQGTKVVEFQSVPQGYGTDPNLKDPVIPWPLILSPEQLQQIALLADLILPAALTAPAPSSLGAADFINEWVSAPYPEQLEDRVIIIEGLLATNTLARRRWHQGLLEIDEKSRRQLVDELARLSTELAVMAPKDFFRRLRYLVVGAYYTSPEGFKDIGYTGNVPLASYPPITDEERTILEKALRNLGLSYT